MAKEMLKGNVAIAEAALRAGLHSYFGYPITPQTELLEHLADRMPAMGRAFVQAESEVAAINMVYGAACTGVRVMTSSSSPGISLMQEGLSYIAGTDVPAVVINVMRGGVGLGNIFPGQGDYFQATRSAGHGDYHPIVLAPASVQEAVDFTVMAFDLAEKYRHLVVVLADGQIGQMMEPAELPEMMPMRTERPDWALTGAKGRPKRILTSIYLETSDMEAYQLSVQERLKTIRATEQRSVDYFADDADLLLVGFGTSGRVSYTAMQALRAEGLKVGLFRPQTVYPYPVDRLNEIIPNVKGILVVEMNAGQMIEDVRLVNEGRVPIEFYGRMGGIVPLPDEIITAAKAAYDKLGAEAR